MITMTGRAIRRWWPLFVLPTCFAFALGFVVPLVMGIYLSFTEFTTITDAEFVGLKNYVRAFQDPDFLHALLFTLAFTIVTTILINVAAFFVAYMFTKAMRGAKLFRSVFFMPNLIGGIVLGYIWQLLLNGVLAHWNISLTYHAKYGFIGMVILVCWQQIGYMMVIYIAGLQNVPGDVIEAASVDGATPKQILWSITIPLMMPSITVCSFLTVTGGFKLFDQNLALTNGSPQIPGTNIYKTEMLALHIFKTNGIGNSWKGVAQAEAVIFFILVAALALLQLRATRTKEVQQ